MGLFVFLLYVLKCPFVHVLCTSGFFCSRSLVLVCLLICFLSIKKKKISLNIVYNFHLIIKYNKVKDIKHKLYSLNL